MDQRYAIEFDTVYDDGSEGASIERTLADLYASTNVEATIVDPHGPGGGWPVVRYVGTRRELLRLAAIHFDDGLTPADEAIEGATLVA